MLQAFWIDYDVPEAQQAIELEGWMDVLEECSQTEIRNAWAEYQRSGPRSKSGVLKKPDAGALLRIINSAEVSSPKMVVARLIKAGAKNPTLCQHITGVRARELLAENLVTTDECRAAGVNF